MYCSVADYCNSLDTISFNVGGGWDSVNKIFVPPVSGYYYLSYTIGVAPYSNANSYLYVNYYVHCQSLFYDSVSDVDMVSRSCILDLYQGESVQLMIDSYSPYNLTSFRGFLYSPAQATPVAWAVSHTQYQYTISGIIPYDVELVNTGAYSMDTNSVTVPRTGTYYIQISVMVTSGPADMRLILNEVNVISRLLLSWTDHYYITRSRSLLTYLHMGDTLTVYCIDCFIYSSTYDTVSFQGLLLY